jgi:hypothetical protein
MRSVVPALAGCTQHARVTCLHRRSAAAASATSASSFSFFFFFFFFFLFSFFFFPQSHLPHVIRPKALDNVACPACTTAPGPAQCFVSQWRTTPTTTTSYLLDPIQHHAALESKQGGGTLHVPFFLSQFPSFSPKYTHTHTNRHTTETQTCMPETIGLDVAGGEKEKTDT